MKLKLKRRWRFKFDQVRQRFRLTPTEKRVVVFVLAAFVLGLGTKCYRDAHPSPPPPPAKGNIILLVDDLPEVHCDPESFRGSPQRGRADSHTGTKASTNHTDLNLVTISYSVFFASPKIIVERVFYARKAGRAVFSQMRDLINRRLSQPEHGVCLAQSGDAIGNYPRAGIFIFRVAPMNKSAETTLDANFGAQRYQFFAVSGTSGARFSTGAVSLGKKCASPISWPSAITKASNRCKR